MTPTGLHKAASRAIHACRLRALDLADLLLGRRDPLVPPRVLNEAVGGFDFRQVGSHLASLAIEHGRLSRSGRILDIGCGAGRLAVPLTTYLTTGEYVGFDISRPAISWCSRAITPRHPRFWFRHVDIANSHYNPRGGVDPDAFVFPCADASVDVAFAASLFTHLLPVTAEHYLAETARVLKPGGRAVLSFYLFDQALAPRLPTLWPRFTHFVAPYCAVTDRDDPEAAVAYEKGAVAAALERHGFGVSAVAPGHWSAGPEALSFQDFVFAERFAA